MKVGIVGTGVAARFHHDALLRVRSARIDAVEVWSPTPEHREAFAAERGCASAPTLASLMDRAEVLHICSPPATHEEIAVEALARGIHIIVEKPFTGYFGPSGDVAEPGLGGHPGASGSAGFNGDTFPREAGLEAARASIARMLDAESRSRGIICYAENWIYAPAITKEASILRAAGGQILWMLGVTGHSGSHAPSYGVWAQSGGGSLMGKGVHPLSAVLYLKQVEGRARLGEPIRPVEVSARTHALTRLPDVHDAGHIRRGYTDVEDFAAVHLVFADGTCADIFGTEVILGGVTNTLEVHASTHRARCNINPNTALQTFNPHGPAFDDIYVVEKIGTKEGWAWTSPDEGWFTGYQHELDAFYADISAGRAPESGSLLGRDTIEVVYSAYLSAARGGAAQQL